MSKTSAICTSSASLGLVLLLSACSTTLPPEYHQAEVTAPPASRGLISTNGLDLTVDWLNDKPTTERHFGIDASKGDLLILSLHFANHSADTTFYLGKTNFAAGSSVATVTSATREQLPGNSQAAGESVALVGATVVSFPLMFAGLGLITGQEKKLHNFQVQEFHDTTISPGQSADGCVYYSIRKLRAPLLEFSFQAVAENTRTGDKIPLRLKMRRNQ